MKRIFALLPAILLTATFVQPSSALPVAKSTVGSSAVEEVGYRKCRWHNGHRHCRWVEDGPSVILEFGGRDRHRHGHHHHNNHHNNGHDRGGDGRGDGGGGHDGKRHNH